MKICFTLYLIMRLFWIEMNLLIVVFQDNNWTQEEAEEEERSVWMNES